MATPKASERLAEVADKLGPTGAAILRSSGANRRALATEETDLEEKAAAKAGEAARRELEELDKKAPVTARLRRLQLAREFTAADIFKQANAFGLRQEEQLLKEGPQPDPPDAA